VSPDLKEAAETGGLTPPTPDAKLFGRRIAVLAGGGMLPAEVARELACAGAHPHVVAIKTIADADFSAHDVTYVSLGEIGRMLWALKRDGTEEMVIAGFVRRPDLLRLRIDLGFIRHLPTVLGLMRGGDDNVMRRIASFFEGQGLNVRSTAEAAPPLLAPHGALTGEPDRADLDAANLGRRVIASLAPYDVGQAVIVDDGALSAVEGVEGTDNLLQRIGPTHRRRVFVKTTKPGQDLRLDLPTIGPDTVRKAAASNVALMAIEAERTLVVARADACAIAARNAMAIVGLEPASTLTVNPHALAARLGTISLLPVGPLRPGALARRDAQFGLALIADLAPLATARAALVARQHVLAVNVNEPMDAFLARTRDLGQWGDGRRRRRNVTLILGPDEDLELDLLAALHQTSIAGLAFKNPHASAEARNALIDRARAMNLYILERQ
jgi:DUF1009 family protein